LNKKFPTIALHIIGDAVKLEKIFRLNNLVGRIEKDKFLIDFRSVLPSLDTKIEQIIKKVLD